jgi:hypothetical protein
LAVQAFDSIHIRSTSKDNVDIVINFTHENVIGYLENLFSESSAWTFKVVKLEGARGKATNARQYVFVISEDKIISEQVQTNKN